MSGVSHEVQIQWLGEEGDLILVLLNRLSDGGLRRFKARFKQIVVEDRVHFLQIRKPRHVLFKKVLIV